MKFFRRQPRSRIDVELKIIGFFLDEYVNIITRINIRSGDSPADMVRAACDMGKVSERLLFYINKNRGELTLLLNGEILPSGSFRKGRLNNYDSMLIFFPISGG